jgi:hypothetical protein
MVVHNLLTQIITAEHEKFVGLIISIISVTDMMFNLIDWAGLRSAKLSKA